MFFVVFVQPQSFVFTLDMLKLYGYRAGVSFFKIGFHLLDHVTILLQGLSYAVVKVVC